MVWLLYSDTFLLSTPLKILSPIINASGPLTRIIEIPDSLTGPISAGETYGQIRIVLEDYTLDTIPLLADRNLEEANFILKFCDKLYSKFFATGNK